MATQAAALRAKLFGGSSSASALASTVTAGQLSTDQLRQATDKLARQQATAEASVSLYRQKLNDAQQAVKKLENAYISQIQLNANLQAKVKSDYTLLSQLTNQVRDVATKYSDLKLAHDQLAVQLDEADLERGKLATACDKRYEALSDLADRYEKSCNLGKGLQDALDKTATERDQLATKLSGIQAELADKTELHKEAESRIAQLTAEVAATQSERDSLADRLTTADAHRDQLSKELSSKSTQLADLETAQAKLELAIQEKETEAQRLAAELQAAQDATIQAEEQHAVALEAKSIELEGLAAEHSRELGTKLEELSALTIAKDELEGELATCKETLDKLKAELSNLKNETDALQETHAIKIEELTAQLQAVNAQHAKELKVLVEQHQREQEAATQRTAKELEARMQEMSKVTAELQEERKKAEAAGAQAIELKKRISELETLQDQTASTQAAAQEQFARDKAALEARLAEQHKEAEEERSKAAAATAAASEQEHRTAEALAEAEKKSKDAQELADQLSAKVEALSAEINSKEAALVKLDKENGAVLNKLDNLNESLRKCQDKVKGAEAQSRQLGIDLNARDALLEERKAQLEQAHAQIKALEEELYKKTALLQGISQVAATEADRTAPDAKPAGAAPNCMPAPSKRQTKRVQIQEPGDLTATSGDEASSEEEGAEERLAIVPADTKKHSTRERSHPATQPAATQRQGQRQPAGPIITEVDSGDEEEAAAAERQPSQQRKAEAQGEVEEDLQNRGRKRSGRAASSKAAGSKKQRGGTAMSGMRGLFSMQTASQGVSMDQGNKRPSKGGRQATATSGHTRKQMAGGNAAATKGKKKQAVGAAMNLFGNEIFGAFGGYGGGYGLDNVSP